MARADDDLEGQLDALYAAPLASFVETRNALAKKLGTAGRKDDAARVKALAKPSAAAWAVNQIAFSSPRLLDALVAAGDRVRAKPSDVRDAMQKRRDALTAARRAAETALAAAGRAANADVLRRVSSTLEAIATYGSARGGPVAGRLSADAAAPGFDEVAALGLLGGGTSGRPRLVPPADSASKELRDGSPEKPSKKALAKERAAAQRSKEEAARRAAALKKEAGAARARLLAAEKAAEAVRRRKSSLQAALSEILFEEKRADAEVTAAKDESAKADAAERDAGARST